MTAPGGGITAPAGDRKVPGSGLVGCEQLVWTWANNTITGRGTGVVAHSLGWPQPTDPTGGLRSAVRLLREGTARYVSADDPAPNSVALVDLPIGRVLMRRTYLGEDGPGRPGRSLTHALLDPTRSLHPLVALRESARLLTDWPIDAPVDRALPTVPLPALPTAQPSAPATDVGAIAPTVGPEPLRRATAAVLLARLAGVRVFISQAPALDELLGAVFETLPAALVAGVTFSSFEASPASSPALICGTREPFSDQAAVPGGVILSLDGPPASALADLVNADELPGLTAVPGAADLLGVADRLVAGRLALGRCPAPDSLATVDELCYWARIEGLTEQDPAQLSAAEVDQVLAAPSATAWLVRKGADCAVRRLLGLTNHLSADAASVLDLASAAGAEPVRAIVHATLAEEIAKGNGELRWPLLARGASQESLDAAVVRAAQGLVAHNRARAVSARELIPLLVDASPGGLDLDSGWWLDVPSSADEVVRLGWTRLAEAAIRCWWLESPREAVADAVMVALSRKFPERVACSLDAMLFQGADLSEFVAGQDTVTDRLTRLGGGDPAETTPVLSAMASLPTVPTRTALPQPQAESPSPADDVWSGKHRPERWVDPLTVWTALCLGCALACVAVGMVAWSLDSHAVGGIALAVAAVYFIVGGFSAGRWVERRCVQSGRLRNERARQRGGTRPPGRSGDQP